MTAQLSPTPVQRFLDNNGFPAFLGTLTTYAAGTTTPQATYVDSTQTTQNTNPIQLNARGECNLWLDPTLSYKFVLQDVLGNLIWTVDNINGALSPSTNVVPTIDNNFTLGSQTFAWKNVYVGVNHAPVLDTVSGNIGYYARTAAEIAAGVTPVNYSYAPGWLSRYGNNTTPGTTDMSSAIINMVNANAGGVCYIDSLCLAAGLIFTGSQYNGTEVRFVGSGEILLKASGGGSNFDTSIWAGMVFQGCDRIRILNPKFNGNRANQPNSEDEHCLLICGSTNVYIEGARFREIRGDGLYIDWYSPIHSSGQANSQNILVNGLYAYNTADDGRNACSIISCDGCTISNFQSYQVGGVVNSLQEPGGLDIEPNWAAQSVTDIVIDGINVVTAGGTGIAVTGIAITNDATRDWNCQRVTIAAARVRFTVNNASAEVLVRRARDVTINVDVVRTNARGFAAVLDFADRINAVISGKFCTSVVVLGLSDFVLDSNITVYGNDYGTGGVGGIFSVGVGRTTIKGKLFNAVASVNALGIQLGRNGRAAFTQSYVVYSVDFPFDANLNQAVWNGTGTDQVTIGTGTVLLNCTMAGFPFTNQVNFQIPSYNCSGRNVGTALTSFPTTGTWAQFDEVILDQVGGSTVPRVKCIAGGTSGTWKNYGVMSA